MATCRKFGPTARNYAAARLMSEVGLRVNEVRHLDLADIKWDLGRFGKIHVRHGKGARGFGAPRADGAADQRRGPDAAVVRRGRVGPARRRPARPGAPLFCSERKNADGTAARVGDEALRAGLAEAAARHLPGWSDRLTPHVLRHFCASQLYFGGMDLIAIQETFGHAWIATTMNYVHVHRTHVEDAWVAGQDRAAKRLKGLMT